MALFPQHVATLHADGDIGFSKEYEHIQSVSYQGELSSEHSMNEDNKNKNRYLNIVACEFRRPDPVPSFPWPFLLFLWKASREMFRNGSNEHTFTWSFWYQIEFFDPLNSN